MIFKEQDCIDVAKDKKATQSSISQWSMIDDASRALRDDLEIEDYAFHTGFQYNPWWKVDLEDEFPIDCIRIHNRIHNPHPLRSIKVELSLDEENWILIDPGCFEWKDEFKILDIDIYQAIKARYVKISLLDSNYLHFKKCEVFVRRVKGYVIASRGDGLGMRLIAMIVAIWLAKKIGFQFAFIWERADFEWFTKEQSKNKNIVNASMAEKEEVFSKTYLENYNIQGEIIYGMPVMKDEFFENNFSWFKNSSHFYKGYGFYTNDAFVPYIEKMGLIPELKECYESIDFSKRYKEIINHAQEVQDEYLNHNFIAIHVRGGEWIYANFRIFPDAWIATRFFPHEIALEIAEKELQNGNEVVIFSEDRNADLKLIDYLNKKLNTKAKIVRAIDLYADKNYTDFEQAFFEINLMSRASKIYATGMSGFSLVAQVISGNMDQSIYKLYSIKELCNIIIKHADLKTSNVQKAMSYYYLYMFKKDEFDEAFTYLQKAVKTDENNMGYKVSLIDCYFKQKEYDKIEAMLKNIVNRDLKEIERALYGNGTYYGWVIEFYEKMRNAYIDFKNKENHPYISFIAAKIASHKRNFEDAQKYLQFSLVQEPKNKIFLALKEELESIHLIQPPSISNVSQVYLSGAPLRVKNHLAYKLGQAVIENSKSFMGYIRMPYVLSYIKDKHKQEQKAYQALIKQKPEFKLPRIETYPDYNEALKVKEHLSYKLGEALMKADKTWYLGGYIRFYFEAKRLKKEFDKTKN